MSKKEWGTIWEHMAGSCPPPPGIGGKLGAWDRSACEGEIGWLQRKAPLAAETAPGRLSDARVYGEGGGAKRKIQKDPAQHCTEITRKDKPAPGDPPEEVQ